MLTFDPYSIFNVASGPDNTKLTSSASITEPSLKINGPSFIERICNLSSNRKN